MVPSSIHCVATIALAMRIQKRETTSPAWMAVKTTRDMEPWGKRDVLVMSCRGRVSRYTMRKVLSSQRPTK